MPTCEVQVTGSRVHSYCSRVLNAGLERSPVGAVQLSHLKMFAVSVQPVQFPANPVHGDSFQTMAVMPDDFLAFCAPHFSSVDGFRAHVTEVQLFFRVIEIQRHHV